MNHAMPGGMDIAEIGLLRFPIVGRDPPNQVLQAAEISESEAVNFCLEPIARLDRNDRFSADSLNLAATQALIIVLRNPVKISSDQLELQTRASRVEYQNVHLRTHRRSCVA